MTDDGEAAFEKFMGALKATLPQIGSAESVSDPLGTKTVRELVGEMLRHRAGNVDATIIVGENKIRVVVTIVDINGTLV